MCALGGDVVRDGRQQALCGRAIEHAQHTRVRLGREELEDGQHAPRADVVAVQEAQRVRDGVPAMPQPTFALLIQAELAMRRQRCVDANTALLCRR